MQTQMDLFRWKEGPQAEEEDPDGVRLVRIRATCPRCRKLGKLYDVEQARAHRRLFKICYECARLVEEF